MGKQQPKKSAAKASALEVRDYLIEEFISTVCPECFSPGTTDLADPSNWVDGMLVSHTNKVWIRRFCETHGETESLYEGDLSLWRERKGWSTHTKQVNPDRENNAQPFPAGYKLGLPASHGQHTCILVLHVTQKCNLACPVCFAEAVSANEQPDPTITQLLHTVNTMIEREGGKLGVVMLSGGEPTVRRDIVELIEKLVPLNITRIMLNTNGIELEQNAELLELLEKHRDRIEVYLQFDGLKPASYQQLRGNDALVKQKLRVIGLLNERSIFFTLVPTIVKGINENEVGEIILFGLKYPYCAGLAIQPSFISGRHCGLDPQDRATPTGLMAQMEHQTSGLLGGSDFIPLPCSHSDCCDIAYLIQGVDGGWRSLVSLIGRGELKKWLHLISNTITFDELSPPVSALLKSGALGRLFSSEYCPGSPGLASDVARVCDCIPGLSTMVGGLGKLLWPNKNNAAGKPKSHPGERTFRITIKQFMDVHTLNSQRLRKCCVQSGTFEDDPRRHQMCWRSLSGWATDFPTDGNGMDGG